MKWRVEASARHRRATAALFCLALGLVCGPNAWAKGQASQAVAPSAATRPVGTVKAITGKTITLTTDAGTEVSVQVQDDARLVRVAPGQKDLKDAAPIQLQDLQPGDRILVRGKLADDGNSIVAASVIAMKKVDITEKQAREREEWQRHGVGGLVNAVDVAKGTITITTNALGAAKDVAVHFSKETVLRRYAPDSVKFDDAKPALVDEIKPGDQLRARGNRSADGAELTADEIVSGNFRNIVGTVESLDASAGTITVKDLIAKKSVTVKISSESQLRKLQPQVAQRIAMRLKGTPAASPASGEGSADRGARPADSPSAGPNGMGGGGGAGDFQQTISRMPAASISDLQKGDAVMIVATQGSQDKGVTAITLVAGVEPILLASPSASTILTPWSMSGASGGDAPTP
jgi:hypothetical protein